MTTYVNVSIFNETTNSTGPARYTAAYDTPIIDDPRDFQAAIVSCSIPLQGLPVFVYPDESLPDNLLEVGVKQVEANPNAPVALTPGQQQALVYRSQSSFNNLNPSAQAYYYVYSYNHLCEMVNIAITASWVANGSPGGAGATPYLTWKEEKHSPGGLFKWVLPAAFVSAVGPQPTPWTVFWNANFNILIPSFDLELINRNNNLEDSTYEMSVEQLAYDFTLLQVGGAGQPFPADVWVIPQEYTTLGYLNSTRQVIIRATNMPIRPEIIPQPNTINSSSSNKDPIIKSFLVEGGRQRNILQYQENYDSLHMVDLLSNIPLRRIGFEIVWKDARNIEYPLLITKNDSVQIKLGFFRR